MKPITPPPSGGTSGTGEPARRDWSLRIATVHGIPIRLHFTFLLFLVIAYVLVAGSGRAGLVQIGFLLGIFFCVVLHELGHSLVAQRYGYVVRDIVLYPIGGVASIEETPRPVQELVIAIAGPLVNVVIAALLLIYLAVVAHVSPGVALAQIATGIAQGRGAQPDAGFAALLLWVNVMLVLFNLLPAFPMDGGRVLRAALAIRIGRHRATRIAAGIGQAMALLLGLAGLGVIGLPRNYMLVVIALFVYFGAGQERQAEESEQIVENAPVSDAMMRDFETLAHGDTLKHAAELLLAGSQQDFPVVAAGDIVGILSRSALLRGLARDGDSAYVASFMDRNMIFAKPDDLLETYLLGSDVLRKAPVLVRDPQNGDLIGMLTLENAMEFLTLRQITRLRDVKSD